VDSGELIKLVIKDGIEVDPRFLQTTFEDFSFNQVLPYNANYPYTITQQPNTSKIVFSNGSNIKSELYETFKQANNFKSLNYYVGLGRDIKNNKDIEDLVTLGGELDDSQLGSLSQDGTYPSASVYFDNYSKKADGFNWNAYKTKLKNIILDGKTAKLYASPFALKEAFNSYIQCDIYKEKGQEISKALFDTDLNLKLISELFVEKPTNSIDFNTSEQFLKFRDTGPNADINIKNKNNLVELDTQYTTKESILYSDLSAWTESNKETSDSINNSGASDFFNFTNKDALIIGSKINLDKETTRDNPFLVKLYSRLLYSKLLKLSREKHFRTFDEILQGKLCHTEIIGFRIDKELNDKNTVIYSTYLENNDTEIINFIDTQVDNKSYRYRIYYYVAVYGNKYKYLLKPPGQIGELSSVQTVPKYNTFYIANAPSVQVFEVEATKRPQEDGRNWELPKAQDNSAYPPNTPIVEPVPYFDYRYRTELKFNFQKVIDSMTIGIPYYGILDGDQEKIDKVINSQTDKYPEDTEKDPALVRFRTQPHKHIYQVFRTTTAPTRYTDFKEIYHTVGTADSEVDSYIDHLQPNVDYYYTLVGS
jgi:hypothetical protein